MSDDATSSIITNDHTIPKAIGVALLSGLVVTYACLIFGWTVIGVPVNPGIIILVTAIPIGIIYRKTEYTLASSFILAAGVIGVITGLVVAIIQIVGAWDYLQELSDYYGYMAQTADEGLNAFFWSIKQFWVDYFMANADGFSITTIIMFVINMFASAAFYLGALLGAGIPYGIARIVEWAGDKMRDARGEA